MSYAYDTMIPRKCPYCLTVAKMSHSHRLDCPSMITGIPSYDLIWPGLYVGNVHARSHSRWKAVATIMTHQQIAAYPKEKSAAEHQIVLNHDDWVSGLVNASGDILDFIDRHIDQGQVLLHCEVGASRSPTVAALWLVTRTGMSPEVAVRHLYQSRPQAMHMWHGYQAELSDPDKYSVTWGRCRSMSHERLAEFRQIAWAKHLRRIEPS